MANTISTPNEAVELGDQIVRDQIHKYFGVLRYDLYTPYSKNEMVYYQDDNYLSLIDQNYGNLPTDTTKWISLTEIIANSGVNAVINEINEKIDTILQKGQTGLGYLFSNNGNIELNDALPSKEELEANPDKYLYVDNTGKVGFNTTSSLAGNNGSTYGVTFINRQPSAMGGGAYNTINTWQTMNINYKLSEIGGTDLITLNNNEFILIEGEALVNINLIVGSINSCKIRLINKNGTSIYEGTGFTTSTNFNNNYSISFNIENQTGKSIDDRTFRIEMYADNTPNNTTAQGKSFASSGSSFEYYTSINIICPRNVSTISDTEFMNIVNAMTPAQLKTLAGKIAPYTDCILKP